MTLSNVIKQIRHLGLSVRRTGFGSELRITYRITDPRLRPTGIHTENFHHGWKLRRAEEVAYYTNDPQDALLTAQHMAMRVLMLLMLFAGIASAQDRTYTIQDQSVVFGTTINGPGVPDFKWDNANKKLKTRSIILAEHADPSELAFRRTGPDNSADGTPLQPLTAQRTTIGLIYSQPLGTNMDFDAAGGCTGRTAEIALQSDGIPTESSRPGRLSLGVTKPGHCYPTHTWALESNGSQNWSGQPTYAPDRRMVQCSMVQIVWSDGQRQRIGYVPIYCND